MFSLRSHLPPAPSTRHLPRPAKHGLSGDLASGLPPATRHESPVTNSFRIRTYEKRARNPFRIRTYKTHVGGGCRIWYRARSRAHGATNIERLQRAAGG